MQRIFISDLHLEDPDSPAFLRFRECLEVEAARVDEIYILGDLVEMWIGDDDDSDAARLLIDTLKQAAERVSVYLMHGNRDFLIGQDFQGNTGVQLVADPYLTDDGVLLSHGDALCVDDVDYQKVRATLRSDAWRDDVLAKSLAERKALGQGIRAQSKASNANKPANIMDINTAEADNLVNDHGAAVLVHGHTHRPGIHPRERYTRYVTGAWEVCGWLLRQQAKDGQAAWQLECFSLARRYGT